MTALGCVGESGLLLRLARAGVSELGHPPNGELPVRYGSGVVVETMVHPRAFLRLSFALLFGLLSGAGAQTAMPAEGFRKDPAFAAEIAAARAQGSSVAEQIGHWKQASALAAGECAECLERVATLSFRAGQWEEAIRASTQFAQIAPAAKDQAYAELLHGSAIFHLNEDQPTPNELAEADTVLKAAIVHDPELRTALYLDGRALAALHKDDGAREAFTRYVQMAPEGDKYKARAQNYLANLSLARATMAPPFSVTTMDGRTVSLDQLHGQVVLLDFWATWCVPCRQFLPRLQKLAADLKEEPFTLVSVSWDEDEDAWKKYVAANGMTWPQVLDASHALSNTYGVDGLPHYFTIDPDGALQSEVVGVGVDDIEARVRTLLLKADGKAHPRRVLPKVSTEVGPAGTQ